MKKEQVVKTFWPYANMSRHSNQGIMVAVRREGAQGKRIDQNMDLSVVVAEVIENTVQSLSTTMDH